MRLVLAEKPSVARDLARVLGCTRKEQGYFAGADVLVTWAVGHLVRLAEPHEMNPAWGQPWRREALPMLPKEWPLAAEARTADQFEVIARLMADGRVTEIVNATDAGREGEAIFRRIHALVLAGAAKEQASKRKRGGDVAAKPVLRFWTSSLTDEAIRAAWGRLRPAEEYDRLGAAAAARAQVDWLIGLNHTRAATLHNGLTCTIGRVQTPTLAMVVRRHLEIAGFVKTMFYEVHADMGEFVARALVASALPAQKYDYERKDDAQRVLAGVPEGTRATVTVAEKKPKRVPPPQLHNLGELQKEANRRMGLPADRTLAVAQSLYEAKLITYPRSSSRYLGEDIVGTLPGVLRAVRLPGREAQVEAAQERARKGPKLSKRFVDGSKLSDHHAIIPTAKAPPGSLSQDERRVYELVVERFIGIFLPDKETEETRIDLEAGGHRLRARGSRLVVPGWTALSGGGGELRGEEAEDRQALPELTVGQVLPVVDSALVTKERKPPPKYTDATLLAAMETAGKEIDDEALREAMKGRGLGTEATRAAIIERLLKQEYMVREGKTFEPTGKGIALIEQVLPSVPHLASPELTGEMEAKLEQVERGTLEAGSVLVEVAEALKRDMPLVFKAKKMVAAKAEPIVAAKGELLCPKCRAGLVSRRPGQEFYGCSRYREGCGFTVNAVVAKKTLTEAQVKELVKRHRTGLLKGFVSKAGRKFDAVLWLNPANEWRVEFEFAR